MSLAPGLILKQEQFTMGDSAATITIEQDGELRSYRLRTAAKLRDNQPTSGQILIREHAAHARTRTGNLLFDGLYALAIEEAKANSVSQISDDAYGGGLPVKLDAFQTGESWKYVWTRDLSYALHLGLANFDPPRAINSLLFKASLLKNSVKGGLKHQIIQDTGSGGSYPISTDRVVWALGLDETLKNLSPIPRRSFLDEAYPILRDTAEQDRHLVFDSRDGLYRGEQSFLDWREQTYPPWTKNNVLAIGMSKALSTNALHYFLLTKLAEYSSEKNQEEQQKRYALWAEELRDAINRHFYDEKAGLYRAYLLTDDGEHQASVARYDLLGQSLAILFSLADQKRANSIISNYPIGPHGPAVVWPQERTVPVYHNQAIWPFVTAYWLKAAQKARHSTAVERGISSLFDLAAANLSNMENYDFLTGSAVGPEVNSRRQLWSVAGYLSMVQDVIFGLEISAEGIRIKPCITEYMRDSIFVGSDHIELRNFSYCGTRHLVRIHLPAGSRARGGICSSRSVECNGTPVGNKFVSLNTLLPENLWEIHLEPTEVQPRSTLRTVNVGDNREVFAPTAPSWNEREPFTITGGRLVLHYAHDDASDVIFRVYCDGQLAADGISGTRWTDPESTAFEETVRTYAIEAVDRRSGNVSHRTVGRSYRTSDQAQVVDAAALQTRGGSRDSLQRIKMWGRLADEITTRVVKVTRTGSYLMRVKFANGAGPLNTGIACAVKTLEVRRARTAEITASGYLFMPQSGDWNRYDLSSSIPAKLLAEEAYTIRICEDEYCRNMSYLQKNQRYTFAAGGGSERYNRINLAAIHLFFVAS